MKKELTERENWFRKRNRDEELEESPMKVRRIGDNTRKGEKEKKEKAKEMEVTTVIFVSYTVDSSLARKIREHEEKIKDNNNNNNNNNNKSIN